MIALLSLISMVIVHSSELYHLGEDITSIILSGINTIELIKMYYGKQPMLFPIEKVAEALKQRMQTLDQNELDENKLILLEMYHQSVDGKTIPPYASNQISEIVRIAVQEQINAKCDGEEVCILSPDYDSSTSEFRHIPNTEIVANDLLKALAHFGKDIFIPDSVKDLLLTGLGLTSLWFKFGENSNIRNLSVWGNDFEEINQETFGKYFHDTAAQSLFSLNVLETNLKEIDFDLMVPNIRSLIVRGCKSLNKIKNIPRSIEDVAAQETNIANARQLRFKEQNGNKLNWITCNVDAGDSLKEMMVELHPEKEAKCSESKSSDMEPVALIRIVN